MRWTPRQIATCAGLLASGLTTSLCWAGAEEQAAAELLFQQALRLMRDEKYAEACPKLVDSNKIEPAVGTLLYLGECYEKSGQTASAWATFRAAAESAQKVRQEQRAKIATERADTLMPRLPKISVVVPESARVSGLTLKRDRVEVGQATWGVAVPVDPGEHVILAAAPGKKDWQRKVTIEPRGATLVVKVPALEDAAAPLPRSGSSKASEPERPVAPEITPPPPARAGRGNTQRTLALVSGGIGLVGLAAGTSFGLLGKSKQNQAQTSNHCLPNDPTACDQTGVELLRSGHTYATVANVGFVVGAIGLVGAVALYLTAPSPAPSDLSSVGNRRRARDLSIAPQVSTHSSGVSVVGHF